LANVESILVRKRFAERSIACNCVTKSRSNRGSIESFGFGESCRLVCPTDRPAKQQSGALINERRISLNRSFILRKKEEEGAFFGAFKCQILVATKCRPRPIDRYLRCSLLTSFSAWKHVEPNESTFGRFESHSKRTRFDRQKRSSSARTNCLMIEMPPPPKASRLLCRKRPLTNIPHEIQSDD
jgi:hypothetical protein